MKQASTGFSHNLNSQAGAEEASAKALTKLGVLQTDPAAFVAYIFAGGKHDLDIVLEASKGALPKNTRIVGGNTIGVVTEDSLKYDSDEIGILLLKESGELKVHLFFQDHLDTLGETEVGHKLGDQILKQQQKEKMTALLVCYDSIKKSRKEGAPELYHASYLFKGISDRLNQWPDTSGMGMFSDNEQNQCKAIYLNQTYRHGAWVTGFSGKVRSDTIVMHGCLPSGGNLKVTESKGPHILKIDGRPAVEPVGELLGPDGVERILEFPLMLTFGIETPSGQYITRLAVHADRASGALTMFEPIPEGSVLTLMSRALDFQYMEQQMETLLGKIKGRTPLFATYINCGGRAKMFSGTPTEEAAEVQRVIGSKMPLFGLYTGVEIAVLENKPIALDLSGILTVFSV